jgi:hypothetical protein
VVTGERRANILKALSQEIQKSTVACTWNQANVVSDSDTRSHVVRVLGYKSLILTLNASGAQPVIRVMDNTVEKNTEVSLAFTTSSDYKKILKFEALKVSTSFEETNTGTILMPNYVIAEVRKELLRGTCTVRSLY